MNGALELFALLVVRTFMLERYGEALIPIQHTLVFDKMLVNL